MEHSFFIGICVQVLRCGGVMECHTRTVYDSFAGIDNSSSDKS
jgi:hypothetical protein